MIQFATPHPDCEEAPPLLRPITHTGSSPGPSWPMRVEDWVLGGWAVNHFGQGQSDEVLLALAWVMLNRRQTEGEAHILQAVHRNWPDMPDMPSGEAIVDRDFARALAAMGQALSCNLPDPTRGATRFHHHHESPSWTGKLQLQAIIGPYLFYSQKV